MIHILQAEGVYGIWILLLWILTLRLVIDVWVFTVGTWILLAHTLIIIVDSIDFGYVEVAMVQIHSTCVQAFLHIDGANVLKIYVLA